MVCAAKGYPFVAVMVETFSIERRKIMRMLGAKVILTPRPSAARHGAQGGGTGEEARLVPGAAVREPGEPAYHRQTTGPEILSDFAGRRLDFFVTGWGTGGTLTGAGEMIRLARPEVEIVVTERPVPRCSRRGVQAAQDPGVDA